MQSRSLALRVGGMFDLAAERERLSHAGYRAAETVSEREASATAANRSQAALLRIPSTY